MPTGRNPSDAGSMMGSPLGWMFAKLLVLAVASFGAGTSVEPPVVPPDADREPAPEDREAEPSAEEWEVEPPTQEEPEPQKHAGPRVHGSLEEGFGIGSADGQHGISGNILATLAYELHKIDGLTEQGFRLVYMRPTLSGHLFGRKFRFAFQPSFDGPAPGLVLAYGHIELHRAFAIRAGVYRPYFTRGFIVGLDPLLLPDRGPVISEFSWTNDIGVTVLGRPFGGKLEYYAAAMNGDGVAAVRNIDPQMLFIGRIAVNPLGPVTYSQTPQLGDPSLPFRLAIGINGYTNEIREVQSMFDPATGEETTFDVGRRDTGGGGDIAMHWHRISFQAEGFYRWRKRPGAAALNAWGSYGQLGVFAISDLLEPAVRVSVMDLDDGVGVRVPIQPGLNLYVAGNHAKLQAGYTCDLWTIVNNCHSHLGVLQVQFSI